MGVGRVVAALTLAAVTVSATACSNGKPVTDQPAPSHAAVVRPASGQLAARVAAARDRRYTASYTVTVNDRPVRMIAVALATDGTWRIDIPGGALGGTADVAISSDKTGVYQCKLGAAPTCARVAGPGGGVPGAFDPRVQHPFTDWLTILSDRSAALSIDTAPMLAGATGSCFSVEPTAASLAPPLDPGTYCFADDGTLTGVKAAVGTIVLAGTTGPAPATLPLPGPVTATAPLSTKAPPPPSASASPSHR